MSINNDLLPKYLQEMVAQEVIRLLGLEVRIQHAEAKPGYDIGALMSNYRYIGMKKAKKIGVLLYLAELDDYEKASETAQKLALELVKYLAFKDKPIY